MSALPRWARFGVSPIAIAVLAGLSVRESISDPDVFWHIRTGQWLPGTWQFSGPDPWSPASSNTWVLHEWLPQLALGGAEAVAGLDGVSYLFAGGVALLGLTVWVSCRRRASALLTGLIVLVTFIAMMGSLSPRPQLVTFGLAAVFTDVWLRSADDGKPRWWLIPVTWLWACSHGMWLLGPVIGLTVVVGAWLDGINDRRNIASLASVVVGTVIAGALTPVGPTLLAAPLHVGGYTHLVTEWRPPSLSDESFVAFLVLVAAVVVTWARGTVRVNWGHVLMLALAVGIGLMYMRTVAVGAAIAAPLVATTLQGVMPAPREALRHREVLTIIGTTTLVVVVFSLLAPGRLGQDGRGPQALDAELGGLPRGAVVCNEYALGGWLLWRHPHLSPAVDGRTEVYSVDYIEDFLDFRSGAPGSAGWPEVSGCSTALLSNDAPVITDMKDRGWVERASDAQYVLLERSP